MVDKSVRVRFVPSCAIVIKNDVDEHNLGEVVRISASSVVIKGPTEGGLAG